jgi:hypothetical protein
MMLDIIGCGILAMLAVWLVAVIAAPMSGD